ncbi:hypothetical protein [Qaidamihabitans albus]|uniref:hypothetical protein n=1 Tax=Qaidamihabitans albus TaxID=2795733 RepID=UPI0018F14541|nr:hypothetical protein [Qaidamihabitans albus]
MPTWLVVVIVIAAVAVIGVVAWLAYQERQRQRLRQRFGAEYDRTVERHGSRRAAHRDLAHREQRHSKLDIRPLSPSARERYVQQWALIQEEFVDRPARAVGEADRLLVEAMAERGYPTDGYDQQVADLSVRHARTLENYRKAHSTMREHERTEASTEALRDAMVRYRTVFEDLIEDDAGDPVEEDNASRPSRPRGMPEGGR